MNESMARILAREAEEAEARADAEDRGEMPPLRGQRARRRASDPSQVYSVRIPVDRLEQLRQVADRVGEAPSTLLRRWALERLDAELSREREADLALSTQAGEVTVDEVTAATTNAVRRALVQLASASKGRTSADVGSASSSKPTGRGGPVRLGATRRLLTDMHLGSTKPTRKELASASRRRRK